MKFLIQIFLLTTLVLADTQYADPSPSIVNPRKIVLSVNEGSEYALEHILSIANNVLKAYGPENVEMKIVAYAKGLPLLYRINKQRALRVDVLMQYNVEFFACANTMHTYKINKEDLIEGSQIATSAVVELVESQLAGYTYIQP